MTNKAPDKYCSPDDSVECEILPDGRIHMVFRNEMADFILRESEKRGLTPEEYAAQLLEREVAE